MTGDEFEAKVLEMMMRGCSIATIGDAMLNLAGNRENALVFLAYFESGIGFRAARGYKGWEEDEASLHRG